MKKIILIFLVYFLITALALVIISDGRKKFYLLNWGEYMDPSLIEEFENTYNVSVVVDEVGSSESMYQKIAGNTTKYDIAIPGDYMIEKMYKEEMLLEIDFTKLSNYQENMFHDDLEVLRSEQLFEGNQKYAIPYFWGAYAIIYSTLNENVEETVKNNGFDVFFNRNLFNSDVKIGMYDIPRWAVTCYLLNQKMPVNTTDFSTNDLGNKIVSSIKNVKYDLWGNDNLKKQIGDGNLDIAFVQLGDFFDQYYLKQASYEDINFNCFIPNYTAAFFDGLVIPKTCENYELALKFIDFFLNPNTSYENASYVGYSPTIKETIKIIEEDEEFDEILNNYPFYINPIANKTAFLFRDLGSSYATEVETIITRAKN